MEFNFENGEVKLSMQGYINEIMKHIDISKISNKNVTCPHTSELFKINYDSKQLSEKQKKLFHTITAKLLYLSKRVRPDISVDVAFFTRRVNDPNEDDLRKLVKCMLYLNYTKEKCLILKYDEERKIWASIDAAYGVHSDYRSHSGCEINSGDGSYYTSSTALKHVVKSSYEAEIVALSNYLSHAIFFSNFLLSIDEKHNLTIFQDNMAVLRTVQGGLSSNLRAKHISIRLAWIQDLVKSGRLELRYCPTEEMLADILTKPLVGKSFERLSKKLLNN